MPFEKKTKKKREKKREQKKKNDRWLCSKNGR